MNLNTNNDWVFMVFDYVSTEAPRRRSKVFLDLKNVGVSPVVGSNI